MDYNLETCLKFVRQQTAVTDNDASLIDALNDALDWAWQRAYLSNPNLNLTFGTTGTLSVAAQTLDLGAAIVSAGGVMAGLKTFWVKGVADIDYIPAVFKDPDDPLFLALDQLTPAQMVQPVLYTVYNGNKVRFANQLPASTMWRADWIGMPPTLALNTQVTMSLPPQLYPPVVYRATAAIFDQIDDTRAGAEANHSGWYGRAEERLVTAIKNVKRRQFTTKSTTQPYPPRAGGAFRGR